MADNFGISFLIGASIGASLAQAFSSVNERLRDTQRNLASTRTTATQLQNALTLDSQRNSLINQMRTQGSTPELRQELNRLNLAYRQAMQATSEYRRENESLADSHARAVAEMERTGASVARLNALQRESNNRQNIRSEIAGSVASTLAVALPVKMAIDFESAMADAAKTIDGMKDDTGAFTQKYYDLETAVKEMGQELPKTHEEIAKIFAAGGQQGITNTDELKEFTKLSAKMSVAFGTSTESAADSIGSYRTALGMSMSEVESMLDLMNQYANTSSAAETDIAEVVRRVGALGDVAGISAKPMTALAA